MSCLSRFTEHFKFEQIRDSRVLNRPVHQAITIQHTGSPRLANATTAPRVTQATSQKRVLETSQPRRVDRQRVLAYNQLSDLTTDRVCTPTIVLTSVRGTVRILCPNSRPQHTPDRPISKEKITTVGSSSPAITTALNTTSVLPVGLLTQTAVVLVKWRLATFYAPFFDHSSSSVLHDAILALQTVESTLQPFDWQAINDHLVNGVAASDCRNASCLAKLGKLFKTSPLDRGLEMLKVVRATAKATKLPERQIRRAVEVWAHRAVHQQVKARSTLVQKPWGGRYESDSNVLSASYLADRKEWNILARTIIEDLEDVEVMNGELQDIVLTAISVAKNRFFKSIAYDERKICGRWKVREKRVTWALSDREARNLEGDASLCKEIGRVNGLVRRTGEAETGRWKGTYREYVDDNFGQGSSSGEQ